MLEAHSQAGVDRTRGYRTDYQWVNLEQISPTPRIAVIASEDQQFPFHAGFDFKSIREAVRASEHGKQTARRQHDLPTGREEPVPVAGHSFVRKALEAYFTVLIEAMWPKERILEMYLNIAQFGEGVYGVRRPRTLLSQAGGATDLGRGGR